MKTWQRTRLSDRISNLKFIVATLAAGWIVAGCNKAGTDAAGGVAGGVQSEVNSASCSAGVCSVDQLAAEQWDSVKVYGDSGQLLATITGTLSDVGRFKLMTESTITLESGVTPAQVVNAMGGLSAASRLASEYGLIPLRFSGGSQSMQYTFDTGGTSTGTRTYTPAGGSCPDWLFNRSESVTGGTNSFTGSVTFSCNSATEFVSTATYQFGSNAASTSTDTFTLDDQVPPGMSFTGTSSDNGQTYSDTFAVSADRQTVTVPGMSSGTSVTCTVSDVPGLYSCSGSGGMGGSVAAQVRNVYPMLNGAFSVITNSYMLGISSPTIKFDDSGRLMASIGPQIYSGSGSSAFLESVAEFNGSSARINRLCVVNPASSQLRGSVQFSFGGAYQGPADPCATSNLPLPAPSFGGGGGGVGTTTGGGGGGIGTTTGGGAGGGMPPSNVVSANNAKNGAAYSTDGDFLYFITQSGRIGRFHVGGANNQTLDSSFGTAGFASLGSTFSYLVSCGDKIWTLESGSSGYTWKKVTFSNSSPWAVASQPTNPVIPASGFSSFNIDSAYCIDNQYLATGRLGSDSIIVYDAKNEASVGSYASTGTQFSNHPVVPVRDADGDWYVLVINDNGTRLVQLPAATGAGQSFDFKATGLTSTTLFPNYAQVSDIDIGIEGSPGTQSNIAFLTTGIDSGKAKVKINYGTVDQLLAGASTLASTPDRSYTTTSFDGQSGRPGSFVQAFICGSQNWFSIAGWGYGTGSSSSDISWVTFGLDTSTLDGAFNGGSETVLTSPPFSGSLGYAGRGSMSLACAMVTTGTNAGGGWATGVVYANGATSSSTSSTSAIISPP